MFTSPTVGIGHYGGELDGLGTAYVLATSDGGASWTVATLPAAAQKGISLRYAFASPSGTTDFSARLNLWARDQANVPNRLLAGDALDDDIRIGGDEGFVAYTASGGK